jgi:hypothetical protein
MSTDSLRAPIMVIIGYILEGTSDIVKSGEYIPFKIVENDGQAYPIPSHLEFEFVNGAKYVQPLVMDGDVQTLDFKTAVGFKSDTEYSVFNSEGLTVETIFVCADIEYPEWRKVAQFFTWPKK